MERGQAGYPWRCEATNAESAPRKALSEKIGPHLRRIPALEREIECEWDDLR